MHTSQSLYFAVAVAHQPHHSRQRVNLLRGVAWRAVCIAEMLFAANPCARHALGMRKRPGLDPV